MLWGKDGGKAHLLGLHRDYGDLRREVLSLYIM